MESLEGEINKHNDEFEPQHLAMIANGASKCGQELCEEVMRSLVEVINDSKNEFEAQQGKMLGAHRLVHNDFTPNFNETVKPLIEESKIDPSKISVYNLWRRFDKDSLDAPFAVCDSSTVSESELIPTDLFNYLDGDDGFTVEIYQSSFNDNHQWYYYPKMQKDEVLMFKTFDSLEKPFLPTLHSAFDDISVTETVSPRESIEVRAICLFK